MSFTNESQRIQIQQAIESFFGRSIDVAPRAMAALQGRWRVNWGELAEVDYAILSQSVFEALLSVSPLSLSLLFNEGIPVEKLFAGGEEGPARLLDVAIEQIFRGYNEDLLWPKSPDLCDAGIRVLETGILTELDLLQAFLQTAYIGPVEFTEKVDLSLYTTPTGDSLLNAGFVDSEDIVESWDGGMNTYRAISAAARKLLDLANRSQSFKIVDPSHDLFQFALWLDSKGSIRVRPFGVGNIGGLTPSYLEDGNPFVYREGIFQRVSFIPSFTDDAIAKLEDMINSATCSESDFQRFFSMHPDFLAGIDYKQIHPQLVLYNEDSSNLIPDFMLEPLSSEFCDILELKLPYEQLVTRLRNQSRSRFRALINEAVAQLSEYRRWFDCKRNRADFHARYGLKAYYPKMILVIGRRNHFKSDVLRQELKTLLPKDLELWTYDDLLYRARKYKFYTTQ